MSWTTDHCRTRVERAGSKNNDRDMMSSSTSYKVDEADEAYYHPPTSNSTLVDCSIDSNNDNNSNNNNATITTATTATMKNVIKLGNSVAKSKRRISLWLLPPEPLRTTLTNIQLELISEHHHHHHHHRHHHQRRQHHQRQSLSLPTFAPHVTLIGGASISELLTDAELVELSRRGRNDNDPVDESRNGDGTDGTDDGNDDGGTDGTGDGDDGNYELHEAAAKIVLERLKRAFQSFGGIECNFVKERGVFAARTPSSSEDNHNDDTNDNDNDNDNDGKSQYGGDGGGGEGCEEGTIVKWNQSCVCIVERSASFVRAMHVAEKALFHSTSDTDDDNNNNNNNSGATTTTTTTTTNTATSAPAPLPNILPDTIERHFKPPLREPHYSFAYGNESIPSALECPPDFTCTEITVAWTHPSSLEGVSRWREIGKFSLSSS